MKHRSTSTLAILCVLAVVVALAVLSSRKPKVASLPNESSRKTADIELQSSPSHARSQVEPALQVDARIGQAIGAERKATTENPYPFQQLRGAVADLTRKGDMDQALHLLREIVNAAGPGLDRAEAQRMIGTYLLARGQRDEALGYLESALVDYKTVANGDVLAVPTLNLLASLLQGRDNARAFDLFQQSAIASENGARDADSMAALGGVATTLQLLERNDEERLAIRRLLERFPSYGQGESGHRAYRLMRLAELETASESEARLDALTRLADEEWLRTNPVRIEVQESISQTHIRRGEYSRAVQVAVDATAVARNDASLELDSTTEQLLIVILDHPDHTDTDTLRSVLRAMAQRSRMSDRRQEAAQRLADLR